MAMDIAEKGDFIILRKQYATDRLIKGEEYKVINVGISHIDVYGANQKLMAISHGHYQLKEAK
jgi:hypothetical protein